MRKSVFPTGLLPLLLVAWMIPAGSLPAQTVTSLTLINADTDLPVPGFDPISDGAVINTATIGTAALNIRANTNPATDFGSVLFALTGATTRNQTEDFPVWALFGDSSGNYNAGSFNNGAHTLVATPYPQNAGGGTAGTAATVNFTVSDVSGDPVADAGPDKTVILPASEVTLNGSGTDDGTITGYAWSQQSGPNTATLAGQSTADLTASNLIQGTYVFRLTVTDNESNTDSDDASVFVVPQGGGSATISGELKKWHKLTFSWTGPATSEIASPNPFADYRLNVTFNHAASGKSHKVPGYYAADGNAADSSADSGNIWRAHFAPDETGTWTYAVSFRSGTDVAIDASDTAGSAAGFFDGDSGSFVINPTDKTGRDLRGKGRLEYVGKHHLQFAETGEYFLKAGADAPENFLAYDDFDATPNDMNNQPNLRKSWSPHAADYLAAEASSHTWAGGKGSEMLGAIKYLSDKGLNVFSFLPFSLDGDDDNVFPHRLKSTVAAYEAVNDNQRWNNANGVHNDRFDVSKMAQWERIFEYADKKGMYLHFKTMETENELKMDGGNLGRERKLYYRELIARFAHHLALNWNLGEEINDASTAQKTAWASYFWDNDPYQNHIVIHNGSDHYDLLGPSHDLTGFSLQTNNAAFINVFSKTLDYIDRSVAAGKPWVVACDEPGDASHALRPVGDAGTSWTDGRKNALWGNVMAGGAGCEFYFGYNHVESDLTCQDWRSRDGFWDYCRHMLAFFEDNKIPFQDMSNENALSSNTDSWCLRKTGETYVLYLKNGGTTNLDLSAVSGTYDVRWFDPRNGGGLQLGSVASVTGGGNRALGTAPAAATSDWTVLVQKQAAALPAPWIHEDVGGVGAAGDAGLIGGTFTITASGADIWGTADEFGFVHQPLDGDGEIVARVESIANTNAWAKAGVMFRSSTAADSAHVSLVVTPAQGVSLQWRLENGADSQYTQLAGITAPRWLRLVRRGHMFSGSYSNDGSSWIRVGNSVRVPVARSAEVGLAVTSHNDGVLTTAVIDSVAITPGTFPRLLFIRGGSGTGGFLEGGADDQLADLGDFSTAGGNHGWGEFAEVLIAAGYSLDAAIEGPSGANTPVDLTSIGLENYAVVIFGSNNAAYTTAHLDALESFVRGGGAALFISDANFGSSWNDAPDSDQQFLDCFGLVVNQDQGTYQLALSEGDFIVPGHPILNGVGRFDGEGVSPLVLGVLPTPAGATITRLARAEGTTRNNDGNPGSSRPVTSSDASLVAVEIDHGRIVGHFDRNTFFNLNGAGTSIQRFDNTQFAINLMGWLSNQIDPITPYEGWAQSYFATLPGGRDDPQAAFDADANGDGLTNGVHYGFGGSPWDGDRSDLGLPAISSGDLVFSMPEPPPADLVVRLEASPSLGTGSWSTIATRPAGGSWTGPVSVDVNAGTATISYTPTPGTREFFRILLEL